MTIQENNPKATSDYLNKPLRTLAEAEKDAYPKVETLPRWYVSMLWDEYLCDGVYTGIYRAPNAETAETMCRNAMSVAYHDVWSTDSAYLVDVFNVEDFIAKHSVV